MVALGWQGGTIHQVARETGCDAHSLLHGQPASTYLGSPESLGWSAARTCDVAFNLERNFPKRRGDLDFWLGVAEGMALKLKGI